MLVWPTTDGAQHQSDATGYLILIVGGRAGGRGKVNRSKRCGNDGERRWAPSCEDATQKTFETLKAQSGLDFKIKKHGSAPLHIPGFQISREFQIPVGPPLLAEDVAFSNRTEIQF
jgi:hypothetical protein